MLSPQYTQGLCELRPLPFCQKGHRQERHLLSFLFPQLATFFPLFLALFPTPRAPSDSGSISQFRFQQPSFFRIPGHHPPRRRSRESSGFVSCHCLLLISVLPSFRITVLPDPSDFLFCLFFQNPVKRLLDSRSSRSVIFPIFMSRAPSYLLGPRSCPTVPQTVLWPSKPPSLPRLPLAAARISRRCPAERAHLPRGPAGRGVGVRTDRAPEAAAGGRGEGGPAEPHLPPNPQALAP